MADDSKPIRHSKAEEAEVVSDPDEQARLEARNALRQFDMVLELIDQYLQPERPFKLRLSMILGLHRAALEGLSAYAGVFRPGSVKIEQSQHEPVSAHLVAENIEDMCDYVNQHWDSHAVHLAAYVMWRLNWIHPFSDGNGRTSRAISYLVLCIKLGWRLPGTNTIPEQIAEDKAPYYDALEAADKAFAHGNIDTSKMEELIGNYLAKQLLEAYNTATGKAQQNNNSRKLH